MNITSQVIENINYIIVFSFSLFFIIYSAIHKRYRNLILFLSLCLILKLCRLSLLNSIVVAYVLCLIYGIIMNYHLMDNYENIQKNSEPNEQKLNTVKEYFSDRILIKYINHKKKNNPDFIITRSSLIKDLKPIKSKISLEQVNKIKKNNNIKKKPILITNDNYIIDGHLRWYVLKSQSKDESNEDPRNFIMTNIIQMNYKEFINDLKLFKNEINFDELSRFKIDKFKLQNSKKALNEIQKNVNLLINYYKDLENLDMV